MLNQTVIPIDSEETLEDFRKGEKNVVKSIIEIIKDLDLFEIGLFIFLTSAASFVFIGALCILLIVISM